MNLSGRDVDAPGRSEETGREPTGLELTVVDEELAICRLAAGSGLQAWASPGKGSARGPLTSISWTPNETSVVCASRMVPADIHADRGWRALAVAGPLDLTLTGVMASLTRPLAQSGVAVFAISTHDTDYLLVKASSLDVAVAALQAAGHRLR